MVHNKFQLNISPFIFKQYEKEQTNMLSLVGIYSFFFWLLGLIVHPCMSESVSFWPCSFVGMCASVFETKKSLQTHWVEVVYCSCRIKLLLLLLPSSSSSRMSKFSCLKYKCVYLKLKAQLTDNKNIEQAIEQASEPKKNRIIIISRYIHTRAERGWNREKKATIEQQQ